MSSVLVVLDVQSDYEENIFHRKDNWQVFVNNLIEKIVHFKNNKLPIILVKHSGCGEFIHEIIDLIKNYSNVFYVEKRYFNGARPIMKCIESNKISCDEIHMSGLYSNCCIYKTVKGLTEFSKTVILSHKYCYDHVAFPSDRFDLLPNISLV